MSTLDNWINAAVEILNKEQEKEKQISQIDEKKLAWKIYDSLCFFNMLTWNVTDDGKTVYAVVEGSRDFEIDINNVSKE